MFKRSVFVKVSLLAMVMSCTCSTIALAAQISSPRAYAGSEIAVPYWMNVNQVDVFINVDGTRVEAVTFVEAKAVNSVIKGYLCVDKCIAGHWTQVAAWSISGTGNVYCSNTYNGVAGAQYRVRIETTIDGETVSAVSGTETT